MPAHRHPNSLPAAILKQQFPNEQRDLRVDEQRIDIDQMYDVRDDAGSITAIAYINTELELVPCECTNYEALAREDVLSELAAQVDNDRRVIPWPPGPRTVT